MEFTDFWAIYPRKVAKADALRAWGKLTKTDRAAIAMVIDNHLEAWRLTEPQFIPYPATWLRGQRWHDELEPSPHLSDHEFFRIHGYSRRIREA